MLIQRTYLIANSIVFLIGGVVLFGWHAELPTLVQINKAWVPMQYNTALGFILCGISGLAHYKSWHSICRLTSISLIVFSCLTLAQYIFDLNLDIDELFLEHYIFTETSHPGRMAPNTGVCFFIMGVVYLLSSKESRENTIIVRGVFSTIVFALSIVALSGYVMSFESSYGWGNLTRMAFHTSSGFIILAASTTIFIWDKKVYFAHTIYGFTTILLLLLISGLTAIALNNKITEISKYIHNYSLEVNGVISLDHRKTLADKDIEELLLNLTAEEKYFHSILSILLSVTVFISIFILLNVIKNLNKQHEELESSHKRLQHTGKLASLGELAGSISHEFNNPIQGVRNVIEILSNAAISEEDKKLANLGKKECDRMARMISGLRTFYRPTSYEASPVDMNKCLEEVIWLVKKIFLEKNININQNCDDSLPKILIVEDQIKQVILNLLQNAADSISGGGQINVTTQKQDSDLLIKIQDTGHGISKENQSKLFDPFYSTKEGKGTGLGLSISYRIIQDHGGNIQLESKLNEGTTFLITLPVNANMTK